MELLARLDRSEPGDPLSLTSDTTLMQSIVSQDGNVLMFEPTGEAPPRGLYLPPTHGHVIGVVNRQVHATSWTRSHGHLSVPMAEGDVVIVPAGESAYLRFDSAHQGIVVAIRSSLVQAAVRRGQADDSPARVAGQVGTKDPLLACIVNGMRDASRKSPSACRTLLDKVGAALAAHLATHYAETTEGDHGRLGKNHLQLVCDYVRSRLDTNVRLKELAALTGYSTCHFAHLFKSSTGMSPMRFVVQLKMDIARELVEQSRMSLTEIGESLGYCDPAHFSRSFSSYWRTSPSRLRHPHS